jgi:hypothetical protein
MFTEIEMTNLQEIQKFYYIISVYKNLELICHKTSLLCCIIKCIAHTLHGSFVNMNGVSNVF